MHEPGDEDDPQALEREIEEALGGRSLLDYDAADTPPAARPLPPLAPGTRPRAGAFAEGLVAGVGREDVFIEFGPREQGVVPRAHFSTPPEVGSRLRVFVQERDPEDGLWRLSVERAREEARWDSVAPGTLLEGLVRAANTGGLELQCGTLTAFLPASHAALERVEDLTALVGRAFEVEVLEVDRAKRRLVVSRRAVLARERDAQRAAAMGTLGPGLVLEGRITRVEPFGAFVDLGGVEGLLHVSELAWTRVERPEEHVSVGQTVRVQVLKVEEEGRRISLSRRALEADPYHEFVRAHPVGARVPGRVTRLAPYGAFVEVAPGVEGLAHVSQLAPGGADRPRQACRVGQEVKARVVSIEPERRRLGLSLLDERGDRLDEDSADDETVRRILRQGGRDPTPEPTLGDLLKRALEGRPPPP